MATTLLYNPDRKSKNQLIAEFVVRTEMYDEIMHDLETSAMHEPEQHYLLVGQRGTGKTTLLNRLKYGIEDSSRLQEKLLPVLLSEEQYNISELANLWESIGQYLEDDYGFEGLSQEIESNLGKNDFEERSYDLLEKHLKKQDKKLILLVDNIGDLLKKLDKTEVHRLREILQTRSEIRLIAGSPFYLESILDYHQPFFEFFKVLRLGGLNKLETQHLLLKLATLNNEEEKIKKIIHETPERIETLRKLTGGVPRTIALMFNIFIEYNNEDTLKDLEKILDAVTPLYKHRMDDLPTQQQKIVDAVAKNWDGISVKELKERLRMEGKIISAQLRQLEKNQVIEIVETSTKNHLYFVKERFFNIWYLMRYGRRYDRQRVIWLVKFLESWCTVRELEERVVDYVNKIQEGKLDENFISFYGEVYTAMHNLRSEVKIILKQSVPAYLSNRVKVDDEEIFRVIKEKFDKKDYEGYIKSLKELINPSEQASILIAIMTANLGLENRESFLNLFKEIPKAKPSNEQKYVSLEYYEEIILLTFLYATCLISLIANNFAQAHESVDILIEFSESFDHLTDGTVNTFIQMAFTNLLVFDQTRVALNIFEKWPKLKEKVKPTYYAVLRTLEMESELKKMGPELVDEVDKIFESVIKIKTVITPPTSTPPAAA